MFKKSTDRDLIDRVVSYWSGVGPDTEDKGDATLSRALKPEERLALELRKQELRNALAPAPATNGDFLRAAIGTMLGGFPMMQRHNAEAAAVISSGYFHCVREQPQWAILEACRRVREGQAGLAASYCPTEPEFTGLVRKLLQGFQDRLRIVTAVLQASEPKPVTEQDRTRVKDQLAKRPVMDVETEERRKQRTEFVGRILQGERERRLQEYADAGLDAPEDKGFGIVSLALLLSMGWRIEQARGKNVLTAPPPVTPTPHQYSHADESR